MTSSKIPALKAIRGVVAKDFGHMENPTIQDTLRQMSDVIDVTEMLAGITRKPTETASVYLERVQANTGKVSGRIARFSEGTRAALTARRTLVAKDADVAAGLVAGGPFDAEIRASFKAMESDKQFKYLSQLRERGDGAQLAAILDAPVILTGLPEKFRDEFPSLPTVFSNWLIPPIASSSPRTFATVRNGVRPKNATNGTVCHVVGRRLAAVLRIAWMLAQ